ncbi:MAG TPA: phosphodiester glycosidase family protein [Rugosimonospora sp.]|nr:phosphodiester glycosidase family protein [Rugosimonospora sp.]
MLRGTAALLVVFLAVTGWSIGTALTHPGTDSVAARLAEWARDHGMGRLVTWAENQQYQHDKPRVGGSLNTADRNALQGGTAPSAVTGLPAPIPPVVTPALAGEGGWKVLVAVQGRPVVMSALLRPDPSHTSYLAQVAWLSGKELRFVLHPGSLEPGHGPWSQPDTIPPGSRTGLVATYNGGFKLKDSLAGGYGGYFADGRAIGQLPNGYAAEIFHRDGSMTVGVWGRDSSFSDPTVVAVRENLHLLVDNGKIQASIADGSSLTWGYTIRNAYYVWRSGVGVTADGNVVFAMGPTLSVQTLADLLRRAGAVRALELDINPDWVSFMSYRVTGDPGNPTPVKLTGFGRPANRYYQPSSRDFVAAYLRGPSPGPA